MPSHLVVVATFPNEAASLIARAILDSNDIPSIIASDGSSSMEPMLQFSQGVRLLVHEDVAEEARDLLTAQGREAVEGDELLSDES
jgi:hypothetical protein